MDGFKVVFDVVHALVCHESITHEKSCHRKCKKGAVHNLSVVLSDPFHLVLDKPECADEDRGCLYEIDIITNVATVHIGTHILIVCFPSFLGFTCCRDHKRQCDEERQARTQMSHVPVGARALWRVVRLVFQLLLGGHRSKLWRGQKVWRSTAARFFRQPSDPEHLESRRQAASSCLDVLLDIEYS